jgi:hypothetical protein
MRSQFGILLVNEAHVAANPMRQTNQSLVWVEPDFTVCMTATPVWGHPANLSGLLALCEPQWASSLAEKELGRTIDPFTLPDRHPLAVHRCTRYAWDTFCVPPDMTGW